MRIVLIIMILIITGCSSTPVVMVNDEPKSYSWWLRLNINPVNKMLRDIPIKDINPDWRAIYEFKKKDIPTNLLFANDNDVMKSSNASFAIERDFNNDGLKEIALVGVYRDKNNEKGVFLAVLSQEHDGKLSISFLDSFTGGSDFIVIDERSTNGIDIWFCMYCNHGVSYKWAQEKGNYELQKPAEDDI